MHLCWAFVQCRGQIPRVLGAAGHSSGNVQKAWSFLVFPHGRPLRTANGFPNPQMVSQNPLKPLEKQANPAFLGTQMVTVPWPCIGDASGESWIPNAESSKTVGNEGFLRLRWNNLQWSLTTANCLSKSAHSFPETFKNSGKQANPAFLGTQMVTVPWPCIGDASGECWIPCAESSKIFAK